MDLFSFSGSHAEPGGSLTPRPVVPASPSAYDETAGERELLTEQMHRSSSYGWWPWSAEDPFAQDADADADVLASAELKVDALDDSQCAPRQSAAVPVAVRGSALKRPGSHPATPRRSEVMFQEPDRISSAVGGDEREPSFALQLVDAGSTLRLRDASHGVDGCGAVKGVNASLNEVASGEPYPYISIVEGFRADLRDALAKIQVFANRLDISDVHLGGVKRQLADEQATRGTEHAELVERLKQYSQRPVSTTSTSQRDMLDAAASQQALINARLAAIEARSADIVEQARRSADEHLELRNSLDQREQRWRGDFARVEEKLQQMAASTDVDSARCQDTSQTMRKLGCRPTNVNVNVNGPPSMVGSTSESPVQHWPRTERYLAELAAVDGDRTAQQTNGRKILASPPALGSPELGSPRVLPQMVAAALPKHASAASAGALSKSSSQEVVSARGWHANTLTKAPSLSSLGGPRTPTLQMRQMLGPVVHCFSPQFGSLRASPASMGR